MTVKNWIKHSEYVYSNKKKNLVLNIDINPISVSLYAYKGYESSVKLPKIIVRYYFNTKSKANNFAKDFMNKN